MHRFALSLHLSVWRRYMPVYNICISVQLWVYGLLARVQSHNLSYRPTSGARACDSNGFKFVIFCWFFVLCSIFKYRYSITVYYIPVPVRRVQITWTEQQQQKLNHLYRYDVHQQFVAHTLTVMGNPHLGCLMRSIICFAAVNNSTCTCTILYLYRYRHGYCTCSTGISTDWYCTVWTVQ